MEGSYDVPKSLDVFKAKRPMSTTTFNPALGVPEKVRQTTVDGPIGISKVELVQITSFDTSKGIANQSGLADSEGDLYTEMKSAPAQVSNQEEMDQECTYDVISGEYTKKDVSIDACENAPITPKVSLSSIAPKESKRHSAPKAMDFYSVPRKRMKRSSVSKVGVELPSPPVQEDKGGSDSSIYNVINEVQKKKESHNEEANVNNYCVESDGKHEELKKEASIMPSVTLETKTVLFEEKSRYERSKRRNRKGCMVAFCIYSITALVIAAMIGSIVFGYLELIQLKTEINTLKQESFLSSGGGLEEENGVMEQINLNAQQISSLATQVQEIYGLLQDTTVPLIESLGELGQYSTLPIPGCFSLPPSSPSGYYWVRNSAGSSVRVYCAFNFSCGDINHGLWRRVAMLDTTNSSHKCPSGFRERNDSGIRTCVSASISAGCYSVVFPSGDIDYTHVCGQIIGYQIGNTNAYPNRNLEINSAYVDGISLTHGNPRQHIWTFAAARDAAPHDLDSKCPCIYNGTSDPPSFVGDDYFCDTGSNTRNISHGRFFGNATLWDGMGCAPLNECCSFNTPPWFYRLLEPTTDDVEMRVCKDEMSTFEDIAIKLIEIYVQ